MNSSDDPAEQIFVDASGRRKRWVRRAALGMCLPLAGYLGLLATGVVSSSPLGTPPWVAEHPKDDGGGKRDDKKSGTDETSGTADPGAAGTRKPTAPGGRPQGSPVAARSSAGAGTPAPPPGEAIPGATPAPGSPATTPAASPTKPGNAPTEAPGQTRRPTAANTHKGGR